MINEPAAATTNRMKLRYAGVCRGCGVEVPGGALAVYDKGAKNVTCLSCADETPVVSATVHAVIAVVSEPTPVDEQEVVVGVAGASSWPETVASPLDWTAVPLGWDPVSPADADSALEFSLDSIRSAGTPQGLDIIADLLSNDSTHPAALLSLWPAMRSPSPADLYFLALRGYPVSVSSARRILGESGASVRAIARALRALPTGYALRMADASTLENMERLLWTIDEALAGSDLTQKRRQEAAFLICARHNPDRFPATLNLGVASELASSQDYRRSWQLYRVLDGDAVVRTELQALRGTSVPAEFGRLTQLAQLELCIDVAHR